MRGRSQRSVLGRAGYADRRHPGAGLRCPAAEDGCGAGALRGHSISSRNMPPPSGRTSSGSSRECADMATLPHPASFNATAWLHALVQIGGGYALTSDRKLWLVIQDCPSDDLTPLMAQIVGHPDRRKRCARPSNSGTMARRHDGTRCRHPRRPAPIVRCPGADRAAVPGIGWTGRIASCGACHHSFPAPSGTGADHRTTDRPNGRAGR